METYPGGAEAQIGHDGDYGMLLDVEGMVRVDDERVAKDADCLDRKSLSHGTPQRVRDQLGNK